MHCLRAVIFACLFYFTDRVEGAASVISDAFTKESGEEVMPQTGWGRELNLHSIPHVSLTDASGTPVCAGILVSPEFVLTTASCVDGAVTGFDPSHSVADIGIRVNDIDSKTTGSGSRVAAGKSEVEAGFEESKVGIAAVVVHEKYRSSEVNEPRHDVAFVKLGRPSNVQPAALLPGGTTGCVDGHLSAISFSSKAQGETLTSVTGKRVLLESLAECTDLNARNETGEAESLCLAPNTQKHLIELGSGIFCLQGPKNHPVLVGLAARTNSGHNSIDSAHFTSIMTYLPWILKNEYLMETIVEKLVFYEEISNYEMRITGGEEAKPGRFPYAVSVQPAGYIHECNGALIGSRHVLTTASCVASAKLKHDRFKTLIGDIHLFEGRSPEAEKITADEILLDSKQNEGANLAIIILKEASKETPIKLPSETSTNCYEENKNMTLYGWGPTTAGAQFSDTLQKGIIGYHSHDHCKNEFDLKRFTTFEICGSVPSRGTTLCTRDQGTGLVCSGESGDPADDVLIGVSGDQNDDQNCKTIPSRFTDVKSRLTWINSVLEKYKTDETFAA